MDLSVEHFHWHEELDLLEVLTFRDQGSEDMSGKLLFDLQREPEQKNDILIN